MHVWLLLISCISFVISQTPFRPIRTAGIAAIIIATATLYICRLFSIPPLNGALIVQFVGDVRPFRSPEYIAAALVIFLSLAIGVYKAPMVPRFAKPVHFATAFIAIAILININAAISATSDHDRHDTPPGGTAVESASKAVSLGPQAGRPHHVVVIIVESLGLPTASAEQAIFVADWDRPSWRARYAVSHGKTRFLGSTTHGELRELCGRWGEYASFDFARADCLPQRFRAAGYRTSALHSFGGYFFSRTQWYPRMGFADMRFADTLIREGARPCQGVFPGACDRDVPRLIGRELAEARAPQFVYWLTLNSHLPIVADATLGTETCTMGSPAWRDEYPVLCRYFQTQHELADAITAMALAPDFPPTDILIVGDHKPPFFDRTRAARFDSTHVPWIYLQARDRPAHRQIPLDGLRTASNGVRRPHSL
jgi:hypothetical protein